MVTTSMHSSVDMADRYFICNSVSCSEDTKKRDNLPKVRALLRNAGCCRQNALHYRVLY